MSKNWQILNLLHLQLWQIQQSQKVLNVHSKGMRQKSEHTFNVPRRISCWSKICWYAINQYINDYPWNKWISESSNPNSSFNNLSASLTKGRGPQIKASRVLDAWSPSRYCCSISERIRPCNLAVVCSEKMFSTLSQELDPANLSSSLNK